jgi:hypothetical protein
MSTSNKFDWSYLILLPFLAVRCVPWLAVRIQTRYVFVLFIIWLLFMIIRGRHATQLPQKANIWFGRTVIFLMLFLLLRFFFQLLGHGNGCDIAYVSNIILNIAILLILHLSMSCGRQRELGLLVIWILICYIGVCIMTITGEANTQYISRILTGQLGASDLSKVDEAIQDGIAQRNQIYSLALLVGPMLYCAALMPLTLKIMFSICAMLFLYTSYITAYSSCLIGLLLSGIILLLIKVGIRAKGIRIIGILAVTLIVISTFNPRLVRFMSTPLLAIRDMTEIEEYKFKIESIVDALSGGQETHLSVRTDLYKRSWHAFCSSPIYGVGMWTWNSDEDRASINQRERLGGHAGIIDILGSSGLLGISLFVLMIVSFMRYLRAITPTMFAKQWQSVVYSYMFPCMVYMSVTSRVFNLEDVSLTLVLPGMMYLLKEHRYGGSSHICMRHDLQMF